MLDNVMHICISIIQEYRKLSTCMSMQNDVACKNSRSSAIDEGRCSWNVQYIWCILATSCYHYYAIIIHICSCIHLSTFIGLWQRIRIHIHARIPRMHVAMVVWNVHCQMIKGKPCNSYTASLPLKPSVVSVVSMHVLMHAWQSDKAIQGNNSATRICGHLESASSSRHRLVARAIQLNPNIWLQHHLL